MPLVAAEQSAMSDSRSSHVLIQDQDSVRAPPACTFIRVLMTAVVALPLIGAAPSGTRAEPAMSAPGDYGAATSGGLFDSLQQMKPGAPGPAASMAEPAAAEPPVAPVATPVPPASDTLWPVPRPEPSPLPTDVVPAGRPLPAKLGEAGQRPLPAITARPAARPAQATRPAPVRPQLASRPHREAPSKSGSWYIERGEMAGWRIIR
jgi:hypothetical protein